MNIQDRVRIFSAFAREENFEQLVEHLRDVAITNEATKLPWSAILNQIQMGCTDLFGNDFLIVEFLIHPLQYPSVDRRSFLAAVSNVFADYGSKVNAMPTSELPSVVAGMDPIHETSTYPASSRVFEITRTIDRLPQTAWFPRNETDKQSHWMKDDSPWGQRKLLLTEIEFLTEFAKDGDTVLYIGAAPGTHIPYLAGELFPYVAFVLYDPARFDFDPVRDGLVNVRIVNDFFRDIDVQEFQFFTESDMIQAVQHHRSRDHRHVDNRPSWLRSVDKKESKTIVEKSDETPSGLVPTTCDIDTPKISVLQQDHGDYSNKNSNAFSPPNQQSDMRPVQTGNPRDAVPAVTTYNSNNYYPKQGRLLFISDIRRIQDDEATVSEDMNRQSIWCSQIKPYAAMLKFRLPYGSGTTPYLAGELRLQPYTKMRSTETRLVLVHSSDGSCGFVNASSESLENASSESLVNANSESLVGGVECVIGGLDNQYLHGQESANDESFDFATATDAACDDNSDTRAGNDTDLIPKAAALRNGDGDCSSTMPDNDSGNSVGVSDPLIHGHSHQQTSIPSSIPTSISTSISTPPSEGSSTVCMGSSSSTNDSESWFPATVYDNLAYEQKMFHFNTNIRPARCHHGVLLGALTEWEEVEQQKEQEREYQECMERQDIHYQHGHSSEWQQHHMPPYTFSPFESPPLQCQPPPCEVTLTQGYMEHTPHPRCYPQEHPYLSTHPGPGWSQPGQSQPGWSQPEYQYCQAEGHPFGEYDGPYGPPPGGEDCPTGAWVDDRWQYPPPTPFFPIEYAHDLSVGYHAEPCLPYDNRMHPGHDYERSVGYHHAQPCLPHDHHVHPGYDYDPQLWSEMGALNHPNGMQGVHGAHIPFHGGTEAPTPLELYRSELRVDGPKEVRVRAALSRLECRTRIAEAMLDGSLVVAGTGLAESWDAAVEVSILKRYLDVQRQQDCALFQEVDGPGLSSHSALSLSASQRSSGAVVESGVRTTVVASNSELLREHSMENSHPTAPSTVASAHHNDNPGTQPEICDTDSQVLIDSSSAVPAHARRDPAVMSVLHSSVSSNTASVSVIEGAAAAAVVVKATQEDRPGHHDSAEAQLSLPAGDGGPGSSAVEGSVEHDALSADNNPVDFINPEEELIVLLIGQMSRRISEVLGWRQSWRLRAHAAERDAIRFSERKKAATERSSAAERHRWSYHGHSEEIRAPTEPTPTELKSCLKKRSSHEHPFDNCPVSNGSENKVGATATGAERVLSTIPATMREQPSTGNYIEKDTGSMCPTTGQDDDEIKLLEGIEGTEEAELKRKRVSFSRVKEDEIVEDKQAEISCREKLEHAAALLGGAGAQATVSRREIDAVNEAMLSTGDVFLLPDNGDVKKMQILLAQRNSCLDF